tara:strand:- start:13427 stop:13903 length:477 start_codon:yes stop_codon:yes gene_type:complete
MNTSQENSELQDLYRELILDHARSPRNFGRLEAATHSAEGINPLCGDKLRVYLQVSPAGTVERAGFEGSGCAISMASASLLTDTVRKMTSGDADACSQSIVRRLTGQSKSDAEPLPAELVKLKALDGVRDHPSRIKCATLAWHTMHAALHHRALATTE